MPSRLYSWKAWPPRLGLDRNDSNTGLYRAQERERFWKVPNGTPRIVLVIRQYAATHDRGHGSFVLIP